MNTITTRILLQLLLIVTAQASDSCFITINGEPIPVLGLSGQYLFELQLSLSDGFSLASAQFHQEHIIPLQKRLKLFQRPIICLISNNYGAQVGGFGTLPITVIIIQKNEFTEGCISSLLHEFGHVWINKIKSDIFKKPTIDLGMINYALKMRDNFIGFGACSILSAFLFLTTSQYSSHAYQIPISYGICRIIDDVVRGHYYNYCRRLEEEICDIFMASAFETKEEQIEHIDQFIASIRRKSNQTIELKFFTFLTGKTHPSTQSRTAQLMKLKEMDRDHIEKLLQKKLSILIARYKRFYSMTGFC
jgi:hypothetical protein